MYSFMHFNSNVCIIVAGMQTYDMCATFQRVHSASTLGFVTPGYLEGENYPNNSLCQCTFETTVANGQDRSLNLTVEDLNLETCSQSSNQYDTLTVSAVYTFEI